MSIAWAKPSRVALSTNDPLIWSRPAKAMAWTRKSISPNVSSTTLNEASIEASLEASNVVYVLTPMPSPSGRTRFSLASI